MGQWFSSRKRSREEHEDFDVLLRSPKVTAAWKPHHLPSYKSVAAVKGPSLAFELVELPAEWCANGRTRPLIIRSHYSALWDTVTIASSKQEDDRRAVLICGNPGIGKTWSLEYLLLRSLEDVPDRLVLAVSRGFYSLYHRHQVLRLFRSQRSLEGIIRVVDSMKAPGKQILMLHDSRGRDVAHFLRHALSLASTGYTATIVVAASPHEDCLDSFKEDFPWYMRFYMPMWSQEETVDYLGHFYGLSAETAKSAFHDVGGVPSVLKEYLASAEVGDDYNNALEDQDDCADRLTVQAIFCSKTELTYDASKVVGWFPKNHYTDCNVDFVSSRAREVWYKVHKPEECIEMENRGNRMIPIPALCVEEVPAEAANDEKKPTRSRRLNKAPRRGRVRSIKQR